MTAPASHKHSERRKEPGTEIYNVVVIGAGTVGLVTAAGTAGLGGKVALIERNLMGGDCLNFGCVPSKALISSARLVHQIRHASNWGLTKNRTDEILRAVIVGPHAVDLIDEFVVAMHAKVGLGKLAGMIHAYPTLTEMARKARDQFNKTRLTPRAQKIFAWLYRRARRGSL